MALDSKQEPEAVLYDVGRYEVRNMIANIPGAVAPVVYGGKIRAVMLYLDRIKMQARGLSPTDVMNSMDNYNLFLPTGSVKLGSLDYAVNSNSMFDFVSEMGEMPLRSTYGNAAYMRDVAKPSDSAYIQTNIVRVNGRRQVYVPVYRQLGASTLSVVDTLKKSIPDMTAELSKPDINLKVVMDQSVYVRTSIFALVQEGMLGAILCSLVILIFLGQWRMTLIAVMTIPLSVLAAIACLYAIGQTINVMTLAGLALAIGPLVDSAIICLENTHRHLDARSDVGRGSLSGRQRSRHARIGLHALYVPGADAAGPDAGHGAVPVPPDGLRGVLRHGRGISPLAQPGPFLQRIVAEIARRARPCSAGPNRPAVRPLGSADRPWHCPVREGIGFCPAAPHRRSGCGISACCSARSCSLGPHLRREFFPEVDAGAFEIAVRAPTGTAHRIDRSGHRRSRGRHSQDDSRARSGNHRFGNGSHARLVGRLHAQCRTDGRRGQGATA